MTTENHTLTLSLSPPAGHPDHPGPAGDPGGLQPRPGSHLLLVPADLHLLLPRQISAIE